jgi:hypothetical protein
MRSGASARPVPAGVRGPAGTARGWRPGLIVAGLSLPLAQLGHFLAYGLRVPTTGGHAYFPAALKAAGTMIGAGLLAAMALLVLARILSGTVARRRPWSFTPLATGLLAGQMAVFLAQEGLEAHAAPDAARIAVGLLAQQPVALAAALALHWLSARMGPALEAVASPRRPQVLPLATPLLTPAPAFRLAPLASARPRPIRGQRAPPTSILAA